MNPRLAAGAGIALALVLELAFAWPGGEARSQRSSAPRHGDGGRSVIIYPPQTIALRMDHALGAHRALACSRCHTAAETSDRAEDNLIPEERSCLPCHAEQTDRAHQTEATCGVCHVGFVGSASGEIGPSPIVPASTIPRPRLRFSHRTHAQHGQTCESCHVGVRDTGLATRRHLPTMRDCFRCHAPAGFGPVGAEGVASAPFDCSRCHLTRPDGLLQTRFREGWMNPPRWMAGMRHDHEWLVRHRWVGADHGPVCGACHTESECAECHDGRVRPRRIHPGDYLTTHPPMARRDEPRCASCHVVSQFCAECHGRLGIAPIAAPDVRAAERWHPPAAVWVRGPNLHAREAIRSMPSCASCHAEEDCVICHGSAGVGGLGLSPHPPGFGASCRTALETNARACITCHGDLDVLRRRCR